MIGSFFKKLFVGEKGIVEQISDVADKWITSETTQHKMSIEDMQAGDSSQDSARRMVFISHNSYADIAVDVLNRLPRPMMALWACGILFGWWIPPTHLMNLDPITGNILWTIVTFFFGSRMIFKDIPGLIRKIVSKK